MTFSRNVYSSLFAASLVSAAASSNNWAGGQHTDKGRVVQASVDIVVPECTLGTPAYQTVPYFVTGWAGIDGTAACPHALLQAGFDCTVTEVNNVTTTTWETWTEWFPATQQPYSDFEVQTGDVVSIRIKADSTTSGSTFMHNHRTGKSVHTSYANQTTPLCLDSAEWVIESELGFGPFGPDGERTAGYTPFKFEHASYTTKDGKKHLSKQEDMFNMVQNGTEVAEGVYKRDGFFEVVNVTPADFLAGE
ncbi:concanavalin A-like lectin/glucanase, partial [Aureobasidium melanogenum]